MALNINLEDVPNEIFEVVRARILKNRKSRTKAKASKPKPALKPLPQFKKVGADTKQWRRPEYAVVKKGGFPVLIQEYLSEFYFDILNQSRTFIKEENYLFASKALSGTFFESVVRLRVNSKYPFFVLPCLLDSLLNKEEINIFHGFNF